MSPATDVVTSRYVDAGGVRLHYVDAGDGPALVCLHGGGPGASSLENFAPNIAALSRRFRVLLVDMPRFGRSEKVVTDAPRLTLYAGAVAGLMDAIGLERAAFIGNSMGGQAAMKLAVDRPERVRALVVIGSTPIDGAGISPMPAEGVRLLQRYYTGDGPSVHKMRQLVETMVYDPALVTEEVVQARYEASVEPEVLAMHAAGAAQPRMESLEGQLGRIAAPTLIVWGAEDRAGPIDVGLRMLRMLPDARMHVFNRCGHWAQIEHADEFNELVAGFLARIEKGS